MPITLFASQEQQINDITKNIYVDKIIIGGATTEDAKLIKQIVIANISEAAFKLHKKKSDRLEPEDALVRSSDPEAIYGKHQFDVRACDTNILGIIWEKI